jgi:hypothetical protein
VKRPRLGFNYCSCGEHEQWIWSSCEMCGDVETGCSALGHTCLPCFLQAVERGGDLLSWDVTT